MANRKSQIANRGSQRGFTLLELIIYLGIVAIVLTSISYLIIDIISTQVSSEVDQEVNYNLRYITAQLTNDLRAARNITSLTSNNLELTMPGDNIIYNFDGLKLTRQLGLNDPIVMNTNQVNVSGSFTDLSYFGRAKNIGVNLTVAYKNPDNLIDYNASSTVDLAVELRGRR